MRKSQDTVKNNANPDCAGPPWPFTTSLNTSDHLPPFLQRHYISMMMQKEKLSHGNKWQEILTEFADRIVAGVRLDYPDPGDAGGR